jgi:predicted transcriptional regulator
MAQRYITTSIRISPQSLESLNRIAALKGQPRTAILRALVENIDSFLVFLDQQQAKNVTLDGNVSEWLSNQFPPNVTPGILVWFKEIVNKALEMKLEELTGEVNKEGKI